MIPDEQGDFDRTLMGRRALLGQEASALWSELKSVVEPVLLRILRGLTRWLSS